MAVRPELAEMPDICPDWVICFRVRAITAPGNPLGPPGQNGYDACVPPTTLSTLCFAVALVVRRGRFLVR